MTKSLTEQMDAIFAKYPDKVRAAQEKAADVVSNATVAKLKATSPRRKGRYARSWTRKVIDSGGCKGYVVHNKDHYRLTHLLENGHVIRNAKGTYGRANGQKHIAPAEREGAIQYERLVKSLIERGL